jgi:hypothetical protein
MPKLPSSDDLPRPVSGRAGRPMASYDTTAIGRGVSNFGQGIQSLAGDLSVIADRRKNEVDQGQAFETQRRFLEFTAAQEDALNQAQQGAKPGAFGFREEYSKAYQAKAKEFFATVPEALKGEYDGKLFAIEDRLGGKALTFERTARKGYYTNTVNDGLTKIENNLYANPSKFEENLGEGNRFIDAIPDTDVSAIEKDDLRRAWRAKAQIAYLNGLPPKQRMSALGKGTGDVISAMRQVESSGDPNAVSSAGAIGLMQVMPGTAAEIAREIGDTSFPSDPAAQTAYLKRPDVSEKYGTYYYTKMLARYGGDEEAALVAYNGGPERADAWLKAGKDDSVLPAETSAYYKKVLRAAKGGGSPEDAPGQPSGPVPQVQFIDETGGKIRDKPIQGWVHDGLARAAAATDPRIAIKVVSGGQNPLGVGGKRTGSTRHDHGNAADIVLVVDGKPVLPNENKALYAAFFRNAAANGFTGLGHYSWGVHVGGGAQAVWGPDKTSKTLDPEFAKAAAEGWGNPVVKGGSNIDPRIADMPWQDREKIIGQTETEIRQQEADDRVAAKFAIETATANAPTAIMNTGQYTGDMPTVEQFLSAYGQEATQKYKEFQQAIETAQTAHGMATMPADEIKRVVKDAEPTSSGNDAALQQDRYDMLTKAADATIKARDADPAGYVRKTFPIVDAAWRNAEAEGGYRAAVAASIAAQQQLGIADVKPLPKFAADDAVETFKNEQAPASDRVASVMRVLVATDDNSQRRALFEQLVDAGLPGEVEGAVDAYLRGDEGAANRLFEAAMVDVSKLPGKAEATPAEIDQGIQEALFAEGEIGDIYYGISDGSADNLLSAQRDNKLLSNAVNIRMRRGESMEDAVQGAAKDLFGDVQVVNQSNAQILLPKDADVNAVLSGLESRLPDVRSALQKSMTLQGPVPASDGTKAIMDAATANRIEDIIASGYFRSTSGGFVYIDPYTGGAVADETGKPIIWTLPAAVAEPVVEGVAPATPEQSGFSKQMRMENEARQKVFQ